MKNPAIYKFAEPLTEGIIIDRPNRFLMNVNIGGQEYLCHCPSTGKIGSFKMGGRPCLLSHSDNPGRRTEWTVEALSYDRPSKKHKDWIGINQAASNRYIGYFICTGALEPMIGRPMEIHPEKTLNKSRLDFQVDDIYIEVKTPLQILEKVVPSHVELVEHRRASGKERLIKHFNELSDYRSSNHRAIVIMCFQYVRDPECYQHFDGGTRNDIEFQGSDQIVEAVNHAQETGVETWIVEMSIGPKQMQLVSFDRYNYDR